MRDRPRTEGRNLTEAIGSCGHYAQSDVLEVYGRNQVEILREALKPLTGKVSVKPSGRYCQSWWTRTYPSILRLRCQFLLELSVDESASFLNQLQFFPAIYLPPAFFGFTDELEDHGQRCDPSAASLGLFRP